MPTISIRRARRAAVTAQLLAGPRPTGVVETVERLGYLQIDPVNAVARAERMVLWSRLGNYDVADLHRAAYRDRALFEYWAFYVPSRDYGLYREAMRRWPAGAGSESRRIREWLAGNPGFRRYVLRELRRRGPLRSRDLADRADVPWRSGGWNDGKNLGRMLDFLLMCGAVAVCDRQGNERVWDLAARCYPGDAPVLSGPEAARRLVRQQLRARGLARPAHLGWWLGVERAPGADRALDDLVRDGAAVPVEVDGLRGTWFADREILDAPFEPRTTLLSPFDRLIKDRELTEDLFGFQYRLEMYVPRAKRRYGYYVLPVLDGDRLVGRVDCAFDRAAGVLAVNAVYAEDGAPPDAGARIAAALADLGSWLGAVGTAVGETLPSAWAADLRAALG